VTPYATDLAYIHDTGHGWLARAAAIFVIDGLKRAGKSGGRVVDLGCGSGILAAALSRAGFDVLGIDQSAQMLGIARKRAPAARFVRASLFDAKLPRCCAVTATGECFNYLFDSSSLSRLRRLFRRVYQALEPGGLFIFDIATPGRGGGKGKRQKNVFGRGWAIMLENDEDTRRAVLTRRIIAFRRVGRLYRRSQETHHLRLYRPQAIVRALRTAGFDVRTRRAYARERLPGGWIVFVAAKRMDAHAHVRATS
jgi:SAM-dependent methyltransferase